MNTSDNSREITLPSGRKATIEVGKGFHARKAMEMADGNTGLYLPSLMSQLIRIDGEYLVMEDFDELPLQDYMALQAEFADQNFTSPQGT